MCYKGIKKEKIVLSLNWTPLIANSTYMKRMLDSKTFQVREESSTTTPGGYMSSSNERRDFIIRLRTNLTVRPYVSFFFEVVVSEILLFEFFEHFLE